MSAVLGEARVASRGRHPTARQAADGRGPSRPAGRRTPIFLVLLLTVTTLVLLGVVMVLSATAVTSLSGTDSAWSLFRRHLLWAGVGTVALGVTMRVDYHRWRVLAVPGLVLALILLALVTLPGVGLSANGARRWLGMGPMVFQPLEPAKLAFILFVADLLSRPSRQIVNTKLTLRPVVVIAVLLAGLLILQPHLGAVIIIGIIASAMLYLAGAPLRPLCGVALLGASMAVVAISSSPWRRRRLMGFLNPWDDPLGNSYQALQSLHAMASGGPGGVGLGAGRAKWGFLPYAHTDFIFAVIAEELGLVGSLGVIAMFVVLGACGLLVALRAPDRFGMLLAIGITAWVISQAVLNLAAVTVLLPVMGMTLPFLSFGGSSLVVTMAGMGVLLNVARQIR